MSAQHIFAEGRYLGSRTIPDNRVIPGLEVRRHHSYALYCLRCGDIWARFLHDGATLTQLTCRPCRKHGDGRLASTHFAQGDPHNYASDWPDEAIAYEFQSWMSLSSLLGDYSASTI